MKKHSILLAVLLLIVSLSACGQETPEYSVSLPEVETFETAIPLETTEPVFYSPCNADDYVGMHFAEVDKTLRDAGFTQIILTAINDINSGSGVEDGAVVSVTIEGSAEYQSTTPFSENAEVIVSYHNIPKIAVPVTSAQAKSIDYMDAGKLFFDAGFINVITDEVYDRPAGSAFETVLTADGKTITTDSPLPFDCPISVVGHFAIPEYAVKIVIDFEANWIFSKYDVCVRLDGDELSTLPHGEGTTYELSLLPGTYELVFAKADDEDVSGKVSISVNSNTTVQYHISCNSGSVKIEETNYSQEVAQDELLMPFSSNYCLRKDYNAVVAELKELGFANVTAKSTTDNYWMPSPVNTVVGISVNGKTEFKRDAHFSKTAQIVVYYHIADFTFEQATMNVTEKDTFEIPFTMTSGDLIESLTFNISNPDVLQRNEDGTYTALIPGTATVTVSSGGHTYSTCKVEVAEIIVPIESITFSDETVDVVVGSTFAPEYTIFPENANYTDLTITVSGEGIEDNGDGTFYANAAGDVEIAYYQDERMVGACIIHAYIVDIEELVLGECATEMFIGDELTLPFSLLPETATCKGITVVSSDTKIVEARFDERGERIIGISGLAAGDATITITLPNGTQYTHTITVKEIPPTEIKVTKSTAVSRIEVGTAITLEVIWAPENTSVKELTWASSNSDIVKVNNDGSIVAVGIGTADLTATHKSGISGTISLTVEPTLVTTVNLSTTQDTTQPFVKGNTFTITASVFPENATNKSLTYSSSNESVVKLSDKGVVTAVGVGTATITVASADGPQKTLEVTVSPSPQKFCITWSASLINSNHVGNNWSKSFAVDDETFSSGSTITLSPESTFTVRLTITENDSRPDSDSYFERISYSDDICKNGYSVTETVYVRENGGRYSGSQAEWKITITITPVN